MAMARSKVTAQGQISVPAEVRRRLGVGPGSVLEWHEEGRKIVVRRSGRYNWQDVHRAVFPDGPPKPRTIAELKQAIRQYVMERHARR
jgi:AbrB family looped-hinge helix DNA binding protein